MKLLAALLLLPALAFASPEQLRFCGNMYTEAQQIHQARRIMNKAGIPWGITNFFKAREERIYSKIENPKHLALQKKLDMWVAAEVFTKPVVINETDVADLVQMACMRLSEQELLALLTVE